MTPLKDLNFKFENTPNDYHLRKIMRIDDRDDLIVLCRDSQEFCNGDIVVRPDALIWQQGTNNFTVVEFKSRFLQGDNSSLYEYFQTLIEALVVTEVLQQGQEGQIEVRPLILYGNGRTISFMPDTEDFFFIYDALEMMGESTPVAGSKLASYIVSRSLDEEETLPYDPNARERGILMHEWLLNPQGK